MHRLRFCWAEHTLFAYNGQEELFLDANDLKRDSLGQITPEAISFFSDATNQLHPSGEKLFLPVRPRFIKSLEDPLPTCILQVP